ncbi:MFS transporter [Saccharopolyspora sp. CA-218241]|uniref:MFS transporter n=1 Tax=Saccharopolyspora sp. CA-218241 TaxID=3240027 RepID=UPI003D9780AE
MTAADTSPPSPTEADRATARDWAALAVLVLPVLLISVDMTVLGFAVPHLSADLSPSSVELLWIVDIYSFVLAALLIPMGTLGDRIGRRTLLLLGSAGFGAASLIAAYAPSAEVMLVARALLGVAGSTLMPSTLSLVRHLFRDDRQRRLAIAVWSSALAAGSALGPLVGGALLEFFWWGSLFLVNVPITALVLVLAPLLVRECRAARPGSLDLLSALLVAATTFPAVYAIKDLAAHGPSPLPFLLIAAGAVAGLAFVRRQLRNDNPMLDVRLFANREFSVGASLNLVTLFAMIAALFFLTQFLQSVVDLSPLWAGLSLLPAFVLTIAASFLAVGLANHLGLRGTLVVGLLIMAVGFALLLRLDQGTALLAIGGFALICFGMGLTQTLTNNAVLTSAPEDRAGSASAVSETGYELGAALGIAVLGSVLSAVYRAELPPVPGIPEVAMESARDTLGGAVSTAAAFPAELSHDLLEAARSAFVNAVHVTSSVAAVILVVAAALTAWVLRKVTAPTSR